MIDGIHHLSSTDDWNGHNNPEQDDASIETEGIVAKLHYNNNNNKLI